jgi:peptide/nickel transport system substrate-binding protein
LFVACSDDPTRGSERAAEKDEDSTTFRPGGTLRIAGSSDVDAMDPSVMYTVDSWFLARGVHRTLVTYPGNVTDLQAQNRLVPDLGESVGEANEDFTEWSYTIKEGVAFGEGLGGENVDGVTGEQIVCDDFVYSFERLFKPSVGAAYPHFYEIVEGAAEFSEGEADSISGLSCPDDRNLVISLTEPASDWDFRMAMPAMTPIARAAAERYDGEEDSNYDRHVVATGPYYVAEWATGDLIALERNSHWSAGKDAVRDAYPDTVEWTLGFDPSIGALKVRDDEYDIGALILQGPQLEEWLTDPELSARLLREPAGCTEFLWMNTTVPPFDRLEVREAVNWAIDRENIKRLFGGPATGPVATSIVPPGIDGHLISEDFNPFDTPGMAGDMERAREMFQEALGAETWDRPIKVVGPSDPPYDRIFESVRQDLDDLGFTSIDLKLVKFPNNFTQFYSVPDSRTAMGSAGWCKDYQSPLSFFNLFHSDTIRPSGNQNYPELDDPEMDRLIDEAVRSPTGDVQTAAWEAANRYAVGTAVWVPWSWDSTLVPFSSENLANVYFLGFLSQIDWPNAAIRAAQ